MSTPIYQLKEAACLTTSVLAYGHFNTIHPGHIRYLRHAKSLGKKLTVAIIGESFSKKNAGQSEFIFKPKERAEALSLIDIADAIVLLNEEELPEAIKTLKPKLLVLGKEFENGESDIINNSIKELKKVGGSIQFHAGDIHYASSDLLSRSEQELTEQRKAEFKKACQRHGLTAEKLIKSMQAWKNKNLIVVGDTIVDQYAACEAVGMSAEAPVVVVRELETKNFIGGASVVASHIQALGANCSLISVVGKDNTANLVENELKNRKIKNYLIKDPSRPTTFKKRYIVENQKLFRVSRLEDHSLDSDIEKQVIENIKKAALNAQGIIVSDFVYGVITEKILDCVQEIAKDNNLMLFGDLQCSSQVGSVTKFKNFSLLCPNEREARVALQDKDSGLELLSKMLLENSKSERLIMKLGAEGFIAYDRTTNQELIRQAFPALSANPLDVAGAGDSLLAVMATGLSSNEPMMATAALGCCMAALAVNTMGNTPINANLLSNYIQEILIQ